MGMEANWYKSYQIIIQCFLPISLIFIFQWELVVPTLVRVIVAAVALFPVATYTKNLETSKSIRDNESKSKLYTFLKCKNIATEKLLTMLSIQSSANTWGIYSTSSSYCYAVYCGTSCCKNRLSESNIFKI